MAERDWIHKYIRRIVSAEGADALRDDVATLSSRAHTIVTMDTLVEGRHFLADDPLDTVGQKLVRVNVSDIFAKGAAPHEALLSIAWPEGRNETEFAALMAGISRDMGAFEIVLIGGDTVATTGPLVLTLTLTGICFADGPVRRAGQCPAGARLWVSGPIGSGAVGLREALAKGDSRRIERYRVPRVPGLTHAKAVAQLAQAAMDISDGLLLDALTLAEVNGRGVQIDLARVWLAEATEHMPSVLAQVTGGDDYQILMVSRPGATVPPELFWPIGELTSTPGLSLFYNGQPVNPPETLGFDH